MFFTYRKQNSAVKEYFLFLFMEGRGSIKIARHTQIQICKRVIKFSKEGKSSCEIAPLLLISRSIVNDSTAKLAGVPSASAGYSS